MSFFTNTSFAFVEPFPFSKKSRISCVLDERTGLKPCGSSTSSARSVDLSHKTIQSSNREMLPVSKQRVVAFIRCNAPFVSSKILFLHLLFFVRNITKKRNTYQKKNDIFIRVLLSACGNIFCLKMRGKALDSIPEWRYSRCTF